MSINQEFDPEVDPLDTSSASPFDEDLYAALEKLCRVFNLDPDTSKDAWEKFEDISSKFTLEVSEYNTTIKPKQIINCICFVHVGK